MRLAVCCLVLHLSSTQAAQKAMTLFCTFDRSASVFATTANTAAASHTDDEKTLTAADADELVDTLVRSFAIIGFDLDPQEEDNANSIVQRVQSALRALVAQRARVVLGA